MRWGEQGGDGTQHVGDSCVRNCERHRYDTSARQKCPARTAASAGSVSSGSTPIHASSIPRPMSSRPSPSGEHPSSDKSKSVWLPSIVATAASDAGVEPDRVLSNSIMVADECGPRCGRRRTAVCREATRGRQHKSRTSSQRWRPPNTSQGLTAPHEGVRAPTAGVRVTTRRYMPDNRTEQAQTRWLELTAPTRFAPCHLQYVMPHSAVLAVRHGSAR